MSMVLPSDVQQKVDIHLATGRFGGAEEILNEALDLFTEQQATLGDLQQSMVDIDAGRVRPLDEVASEIRARHGWSKP